MAIVLGILVLLGAIGGLLELLTTDETRLEALSEAIADDADISSLVFEGDVLEVSAFLEHPGDDGTKRFAKAAADIAKDVSNSGLDYRTLRVRIETDLREPDGSVARTEVVYAEWEQALVDETGWFFLDDIEFLIADSSTITLHEPGLETGLAVLAGETSTTETVLASPTTTITAEPPATTWCVEEDGEIPINRSCFVYWPLIVEEGTLLCDGHDIIFRAPNGVRYGVNGNASGKDIYEDIELLLTDVIAERMELQSFIDLAGSIPDCEIDGLGDHATPTASQTTTMPSEFEAPRLGSITGSSTCADDVGDAQDNSAFQVPQYLDLEQAEFIVTASTVEVRWTVAEQVPADLVSENESPIESGSFVAYVWSDDRSVLPGDEEQRSLILAVDIWPEGLKAAHEGVGDSSFGYINGTGTVTVEDRVVSARFNINELGEMPARFIWSASIEAVVLEDPSDTLVYSIVDDSACPRISDGGKQFPEN